MNAIRGRELEAAISRGNKHYRTVQRADFDKREIRRLWNGTIVGGAPIDFTGVAWGYGPRGENIGIAVEAKETHGDSLSFGESGLRPEQHDKLNTYVAQTKSIDGVPQRVAYLVVDFTSEHEGERVWRVDWRVIQREFINVAWRKSLTLRFFHAFGERCKIDCDQRGERRVFVLDAVPHSERETATLEIIAERAGKPRIEIFPAELPATRKQLSRRERLAAPMPTDPEERKRRTAEAMQAGIDRLLKKGPKRSFGRGRR